MNYPFKGTELCPFLVLWTSWHAHTLSSDQECKHGYWDKLLGFCWGVFWFSLTLDKKHLKHSSSLCVCPAEERKPWKFRAKWRWLNDELTLRSSWAGRSVFHFMLTYALQRHWPTTHCKCAWVSQLKLHGVESQEDTWRVCDTRAVCSLWGGGLEKWWNWHAPLTELWKMTRCSEKLHTAEIQSTYELMPLVSDADTLKVSNHN